MSKSNSSVVDPAVPLASFSLKEQHGDLFHCPSKFSLAHCVSEDLHMGKGIAAVFKKQFGGLQELKDQRVSTGAVAVLCRDGRYIYYLVTKDKYWKKPTYATLKSSLTAMRQHCSQNDVKHLAMPRIGCGLDKLKWESVAKIIKDVFANTR